ncbi:acyl-CoA dehydrogenase family protein [Ornithinimicrobium cavernae]|uniref:acyl-CoA dehydrogenase family protein n=1 Tax=Ornithinimicrobium cavernae TaxID=2666047 RepID=UPI000D6873E9|nr:acyl-CoA dehydrogenase family protein [Ornithinimicrobium cavernae]
MGLAQYSPADEQLRAEMIAFLEEVWSPERQLQAIVEQHHHQDHIDLDWEHSFWKQLGERGWLGIGIPEEYGGSGGTALRRHLFTEVMSYYGAPYPRAATTIIAPALVTHADEQLKARYLPRIARGEVNFCLGYSEPEAGTDLASLKMRARRDGDHYVLDGMKLFTTRAQRSDYVYLAARTNSEGRKHEGITLFIVDLNDPGVTIEKLPTMDGRTNITYYDQVRVPVEDRVGEEGKGWSYLTGALGLERVGVFPIGHIRRCLEEVVRLAKQSRPDGVVPYDSPSVRQQLAALHVEFTAVLGLVEGATIQAVEEDLPGFVAAQVKTSVTEFKQRLVDVGGTMLGQYGQLMPGALDAPLDGAMPMLWADAIVHTFGAGTNEVQRDMIAQRGLGLPRSR